MPSIIVQVSELKLTESLRSNTFVIADSICLVFNNN